MELSREDSLRLHVLLNQPLQAVRIDEGAMVLHALTEQGEARVALNPNCRDEQYLRQVRELLSTHVLGSPGGYPVFLRRWTRMGQARAASLDKLLLLGEPEAVVAVVHAEGLSNELARRAWWIMPTADNARRMLEKEDVVRGDMGPELAAFLVEFLPFEEESRAILDSIRLVLQPGLIDAAERDKLWRRARQKTLYYVGFLVALPDALPEPEAAHPAHAELDPARLAADTPEGLRRLVAAMRDVLGASGQTFLRVALEALRKPRDQEVVNSLLNAIGNYFVNLREFVPAHASIEEQIKGVDALLDESPADSHIGQFLATWGAQRALLRAALMMSGITDAMVTPIFARTDAMGTVMRRKLEPVIGPISEQLRVLRHAGGGR